MQLVIIAGGFGTRLRPLTLNRPKALVPLVDRPQIAYTLDSLPAICDEVIIAVNYGFEQMREFFRTHERSEEHTSELQSLAYLVCRLLLEKKNKRHRIDDTLTHM